MVASCGCHLWLGAPPPRPEERLEVQGLLGNGVMALLGYGLLVQVQIIKQTN